MPAPATLHSDSGFSSLSHDVTRSVRPAAGGAIEQLRLESVDKAAVRDLVRRYKAEVQALARARAGISEERITPCADKSSASVAIIAPFGEAEGHNWLLDWGEEVPASAVDAAHPAVHLSSPTLPSSRKKSGKQIPVAAPTWSTEQSCQGKAYTAPEYSPASAPSEYGPGWLPPLPLPLPPRSSEAGSDSACAREKGPEQQRSPNVKSIRLHRAVAGEHHTYDHAAAPPITVFRAAFGTEAGYVRRPPNSHSADTGGADMRRQQQQHSRVTKASNVLNSMSAFLSREVLTAGAATSEEPGDSMRI